MGENYANLDDAALVAAVLAGDREAFTPLVQRYYASVARLCQRIRSRRRIRPRKQRSRRSLANLRDPERFGAWFHAIATKLVGDQPSYVAFERDTKLDPLQAGLATSVFGGGWESHISGGWLLVVAFAPSSELVPKAYDQVRVRVKWTNQELAALLPGGTAPANRPGS